VCSRSVCEAATKIAQPTTHETRQAPASGVPGAFFSNTCCCFNPKHYLSLISVGLLLSSCFCPCLEPLLLPQEKMDPVTGQSSSYKTRVSRLPLGTGMILSGVSLIHTAPVSPDMRGSSIFDSCSLLHHLHHSTVCTADLTLIRTAQCPSHGCSSIPY
jgi:hypothetical protein